MSVVSYMVCPLCARMNGQQHHDGCPNDANYSAHYHAGWVAARDALVPPLCDEISALRALARPSLSEGALHALSALPKEDQ